MADERRKRTRRRFLAATGVAVVAGVAGCQSEDGSEVDGGSSGTTTTTPGEAGADGFPAGTSDAGIESVETLVSATQTALANTDYETASTLDQPQTTVEQSRRSSRDDQRQLQTFETEQVSNQLFVADGTTYFRSERDGEVTYQVGETQGSFEDRHRRPQLGDAESLGGILEQGSYAPGGTATVNGRRARRFTVESASLPNEDSTVTSATGSALVDSDSVVHEGRLALELQDGSLDRVFTITALGPLDVSEPDWVETARQQGG